MQQAAASITTSTTSSIPSTSSNPTIIHPTSASASSSLSSQKSNSSRSNSPGTSGPDEKVVHIDNKFTVAPESNVSSTVDLMRLFNKSINDSVKATKGSEEEIKVMSQINENSFLLQENINSFSINSDSKMEGFRANLTLMSRRTCYSNSVMQEIKLLENFFDEKVNRLRKKKLQNWGGLYIAFTAVMTFINAIVANTAGESGCEQQSTAVAIMTDITAFVPFLLIALMVKFGVYDDFQKMFKEEQFQEIAKRQGGPGS